MRTYLNLKVRRFLTTLFLLISFSLSAQAADHSPLPHELKASYFPVQRFFGSMDNSGMYVQALFKVLAKYIDLEISFAPLNDATRSFFDALQSGEGNVAAFVVKSPEKMLSLRFSKNPIAATDLLIVTNQGKNFDFNDHQALNGKRIAIFSANTLAKSRLDEYLVAKNISMQYQRYKDPVEFAQSDADFHLVNSHYFLGNKNIIARIGAQNLYFATLPKHQKILDALDYALEQAQKLDAEALHELEKKYLDKSTESLNLSAAENYLLNTRKPYSIGYSKILYPVQFSDESGEPKGIAMEVQKLFSQMHPKDDTFIPYIPNSGADLTKFDMLFAIVGDHEAKKKHFLESKPYLTVPMYIFEPMEQSSVEKPIIGMLDYSVIDHTEIQEHFPYWKLQTYNTFMDMFNDYDDKKIQYMLVSESGTEYAFSELGVKENKLGVTKIMLPLKFYVAKKHAPTALNIVNAFIDALNDKDLNEILLNIENTARAPATPLEFLGKYKFSIASAIIAIIALLLLIHITRLHLVQRKLHKLSFVDKLTGLVTKEKTLTIMEHVLPKAFPYEYMVLCIDIDKFHLLHQVYGKEKADDVLCLFAAYVREQFGDKNKEESVCRLRDDLFLVFTKAVPMLDDWAKSERTVEFELDIKNILHSSYNISMSLGVYIIDDVSLPVETILDYVNMARRMGKNEHGITTNYFNEQSKHSIDSQKEIIHRMDQAIENKEFILNFQPQMCLKTNAICGAEVLVRWYRPDGSTIYPDIFIPLFETNAFIANLDIYVFEKTCQFIKEYRDKLALPPLAINLSGISIIHPETQAQIQDMMELYNITTDELKIEITESAMVNEANDFTKNIQELSDTGFKLALDDFGTGVSSLYRLSILPVDTVKLDKAFLDAKLTTKKGILLVASIISMLHRLEIQAIAEGVETSEHIKILKKLNCDVVQGYYYFKPLDEKNFIKTLNDENLSL